MRKLAPISLSTSSLLEESAQNGFGVDTYADHSKNKECRFRIIISSPFSIFWVATGLKSKLRVSSLSDFLANSNFLASSNFLELGLPPNFT
jgi:transcriptional regulator of met regulon